MAAGITSNAQEIKYGAKAGVNFASQAGARNSKTRTSLHFGAVAEFKFTDVFAIQPELVYSMQGGKQTEEDFYGDYQNIIKTNYLLLPIVAKYYVVDGISIELGPQVGYLLSAKGEHEYPEGSYEGDITDYFKRFDFGLTAGVAFDLPIGLFFNIRYYGGLTNIIEDAENTEDSITNDLFTISAGYKF